MTFDTPAVLSKPRVFDREGMCKARRFIDNIAQPAMADTPDRALASMGIYVTPWPWLRQILQDSPVPMDFGHDILPKAVERGEVGVYCFAHPKPKLTPYWRDVGTVEALENARHDFQTMPRPFNLPVLPKKFPA